MKRLLRPLLLAMAATMLLCMSAFAMDTQKDPGHPADKEKVRYTTTGTGAKLTGSDNEYFSVEAAGTTDTEYLLLVLPHGATQVTESSVLYIDQAKAAANKVSFAKAFPKTMTKGTQYDLYILGGDRKISDGAALTFSYDYSVYAQGDVDMDGALSAQDALWVLEAMGELRELTDAQISLADMDSSHDLSAQDALMILQSMID